MKIEFAPPPGHLHEGFCTANDLRLHYVRTGGELPALIALHGLLGSGRCLAPMLRPLSPRLDVVLPDARGHGKSAAPSSGYTYRDLANDVIGLIDALDLEQPVLLGHSMGGMTAAVATSALGSRIAGLVLIDPTFISPAWQREVFESDLVIEHRRLVASTKIELMASARLKSPHRSDEILGHLADARLATHAAAFEILTPPNPDFRELVRDIDVPMLLITGGRGVVSNATRRRVVSAQSAAAPCASARRSSRHALRSANRAERDDRVIPRFHFSHWSREVTVRPAHDAPRRRAKTGAVTCATAYGPLEL